MNRSGFTVVEVLISASMLLALSLLLVTGWSQGMRAWRTVAEKNEVVTQGQRLVRLLERELEASSATSVEVATTPPALSFASSFDLVTRRQFEADAVTGSLNWQKRVVFYFQDQAVYRRELATTVGSSGYTHPLPTSDIDLGSGIRPFTFYTNQGSPVAREVSEAAFEADGAQVRIRITLVTPKGTPVTFESVTGLRNS